MFFELVIILLTLSNSFKPKGKNRRIKKLNTTYNTLKINNILQSNHYQNILTGIITENIIQTPRLKFFFSDFIREFFLVRFSFNYCITISKTIKY